MRKHLKLGTRGSELALLQTERVKQHLEQTFPDYHCEIITIHTKGDIDKKTPLKELGGKGVFIKELEKELLDDQVDIAVHSLKDVTTEAHPELVLSGFLSPESTSDALVSKSNGTLQDLPPGSRVGTGSMRRVALLNHLRPDLEIIPIRGNVKTRLNRILEGDCDAVVLSTAGLKRLDISTYQELDPTEFIPAPGQGVIALQSKRGDISDICDAISDPHQAEISRFEYSIIDHLNLHCGFPYGTYTRRVEGKWVVNVFFQATETSIPFFKTYTTEKKALNSLFEIICNDITIIKHG